MTNVFSCSLTKISASSSTFDASNNKVFLNSPKSFSRFLMILSVRKESMPYSLNDCLVSISCACNDAVSAMMDSKYSTALLNKILVFTGLFSIRLWWFFILFLDADGFALLLSTLCTVTVVDVCSAVFLSDGLLYFL